MMYVALLRGINVGGNSKVEMKKLKASFESIGLKDVLTCINSGNIIFSSKIDNKSKLTTSIEKIILKDFGLSIKVLVKSYVEILKLEKSIDKKWVNDTIMRTDVLFLWDEIDDKTILKEMNAGPVDTIKYVPGAVVWNILKEDRNKSRLSKIILSKVYKQITIRNINTVRKLVTLMTPKK